MAVSFGEPITGGLHHTFTGELVWSGRSDFQKIDVYDHEHFGRVLTLDDTLQTSERDEFFYHEMLVHPVLCSLEEVGDVLVIGGGDGGTLRHVLMHGPSSAVMCEIDGEVVNVSREYLPSIAGDAFEDERGRVVIADGAAFVDAHTDAFDAIIVDSTDPVGAAEILFSVSFYESCRKALRPGGAFVSQTGTPIYNPDEFARACANMRKVFSVVEPYIGYVPIYPGVFWSFTTATDAKPVSETEPDEISERLRARGVAIGSKGLKVYSPRTHRAAFQVPPFIAELL